MLKITILAVGKIKEKYMRDAIDEYVKRMSKNYKVNFIEAAELDSVEKEGNELLRLLPDNSYPVALDLGGKMISSTELADFISENTANGISHFTFIIGGSDGLDKRLVSKARLSICLSRMTFTHQMARLILCEQLYRAMKINNGEKYHK
jgi:23S rRNA (pseudouridine1915-N3)-methyltransferase